VIEKAYAKINLTLEIVGKLPDGYHEINSIFQRVSVYDEIEINESFVDEVNFYPNLKTSQTTIHNAIRFFSEAAGVNKKVKVVVKKNIPIGSGLGGGSSDGALTLKMLNSLFNCPLDRKKLLDIALKIGSDVPFFLNGSTALVEGRGEIVRALKSLKNIYFLVIFPQFFASTRNAYTEFDNFGKFSGGEFTQKMRAIIEEGNNCHSIEKCIYNDFELLYSLRDKRFINLFKKIEELTKINFHLTGSGSSIFAISDNAGFLKSKQKIIEIGNPELKTLIAETV
jgi:4-diphosphocytidyl-2-C-methyl-D-erythritol kinase